MTQIFHRLLQNRDGSILPLVGLTMFLMVGATGLAIDIGRKEFAQSKLQSSLDAAGLAVGASVNSKNINDELAKYMTANYTGSEIRATITSQSVELTPDQKLLKLNATATMPTSFMNLFGYNSMTISASSEITRQVKGLELAMVLDVTGSMAGTKITQLKGAATDLVNIVFGNQDTGTNLWVGIVPFSQTVNVGTSHSGWLASNTYSWGPTTWGGCVDARVATGRDMTDDVPATEKLPAYYWADDNNGSGDSNTNDWYNPTTNKYKTLTTSLGPNKYCPQAITPLSNQRQPLLTAINSLAAIGNTLINFGAVWGWRLLSPSWRGLWGGTMNTNSLPLNYNTDLMMKAAIIMTDGDNTIDNTADGAYGFLKDNKLGTTTTSTAVTKLNTKLTTVCNAMKAKGILVYTVLFQNSNTSTANLLKGCASNESYFFNTSSGVDLQAAFHKIGDSLANLRISH